MPCGVSSPQGIIVLYWLLQKKNMNYTDFPRYDVYALGLELQTGFPNKNRQGENLTIHDLDEESLFGNE